MANTAIRNSQSRGHLVQVILFEAGVVEKKVRYAHIIYGLFQGSQIVSFPKIIANSSQPAHWKQGNHAKKEWSPGKVVTECGIGYQSSSTTVSFLKEDSPEGKVVQTKEMHTCHGN